MFYLQKYLLVLINVRGCVDAGVMVRLQELGKLKNSMTSSELEPTCSTALQLYLPRRAFLINQLQFDIVKKAKTGLYYYFFRHGSQYKNVAGLCSSVGRIQSEFQTCEN